MEEDTAVAAVPAEDTRPRLDRERILDAAEAIVASEGVAKLTMRRLGTDLGVDPTAVYRYYRNKDELLIALTDRLFATQAEVDPTADWRDQLKAVLRHAVNRYRSSPELALLLAVQPDDTPSLQAIAEKELAMLAEVGLSPQDAALMHQVIESHVVGTGLYYALSEQRSGGDPRVRDPSAMRRVYALLPADRFPHAIAAAPYLFPSFEESFGFVTDMIIDTIERLAQRSSPAPGQPPHDGAPA